MSDRQQFFRGLIMSRGTTVIALLAAAILAGAATGQTTSAPQAAGRTVVATAKLANVADAPIYFRAVRVTIAPGEKSSISADDGIIYQIAGSTTVSSGEEARTINAGEGLLHSPSNVPHHRTGAALYNVLAGTGAITVEGKTEAKEAGSFVYEPSTLVHQWGNPGDEPFTFLVFNINPEGTAAVVPAAPMKTQ